MKEFVFDLHSIITIEAEDEEAARQKFWDILEHDLEFYYSSVKSMELLDEYNIED